MAADREKQARILRTVKRAILTTSFGDQSACRDLVQQDTQPEDMPPSSLGRTRKYIGPQSSGPPFAAIFQNGQCRDQQLQNNRAE
jgi:hypothetical protein